MKIADESEKLMKHTSFSVEIILDPGNSGWILEKIANRISQKLSEKGCDVRVKHSPEFNTNITFWIQYTDKTLHENLTRNVTNIWCALVTHVDESQKLTKINNLRRAGVNLLFMSNDQAKSISKILKQSYDFPSINIGSDLAEQELVYKVGIVSKCYPDGRKNETWFESFLEKGLLENVTLTIIGTGWDSTVKKLRAKGANIKIYDGVENFYPSYEEIVQIQKSFDLFVYFGFDEGSLGALDAYLLNTDLLITKQGFHLDFEIGEDSFCKDLHDAQNKFSVKKNAYLNSRPNRSVWTWENTAITLLEFWDDFGATNALKIAEKSSSNLELFFSNAFLRMLPKSLYRFFFIRIPRKIFSFLSNKAVELFRGR